MQKDIFIIVWLIIESCVWLFFLSPSLLLYSALTTFQAFCNWEFWITVLIVYGASLKQTDSNNNKKKTKKTTTNDWNTIAYIDNLWYTWSRVFFSTGPFVSVRCTVKPQWLEHGWLVYRGWFELFFQSLQNSSNSSRKQIFSFFLSCNCMLCVLIRIASSRRF